MPKSPRWRSLRRKADAATAAPEYTNPWLSRTADDDIGAKELALGLGLALSPTKTTPAEPAPKKKPANYICPANDATCEFPRIKPKKTEAGQDVHEGHIDELYVGDELWSCDYSVPYTLQDGAPSDWNQYSGGGPGEGTGVEFGPAKLLTLTDPSGLQVRQETAPQEWAAAQNSLAVIFQEGAADAQAAEESILAHLPTGHDDV